MEKHGPTRGTTPCAESMIAGYMDSVSVLKPRTSLDHGTPGALFGEGGIRPAYAEPRTPLDPGVDLRASWEYNEKLKPSRVP